MLALVPLRDTRAIDIQSTYAKAKLLFLRGYLEKSEHEAGIDYDQLQNTRPDWAPKFRLIEAESMVSRGKYDASLRIFEEIAANFPNSPETVERLSFQAQALSHLGRFSEASAKLARAERLCEHRVFDTCGLVPRMHGVLAVEQGEFTTAHDYFSQCLEFARAHHDPWLEASALSNLSVAALQQEHFDEAADWSRSAYRAATSLGAEDLAQRSQGNLGWAYFGLGDIQKSLGFFLEAEKRAAALGDLNVQLNWLTTTADAYQEEGNFERAQDSYRKAVKLAKQLNSKEDMVNALEDLAHALIDERKTDDAEACLRELDPLIQASGNRLDALDVEFARARIAAARRQWPYAEEHFRIVDKDPASQTSMRMDAEHQLAMLYEVESYPSEADGMYRTALSTFRSARDQLKDVDSRLPFLANAARIYDDYVHFLIDRGRSDQALEVADESRAQTLEQGLNRTWNSGTAPARTLRPSQIAQMAHASLLFYWLGEKQSYLWTITPRRTAMFPLPPRHQIEEMVGRYRETLLGFSDPLEKQDADGIALYRMLVEPASAILPLGSKIVILGDGALNQLNFETLIVPGTPPHYWIEDANLVSAPSLRLLASATTSEPPGGRLLLIGDAISPNPDYPDLPMAADEMKQIMEDFGSQNTAVYARAQATATGYLQSRPQSFAYIHFVAHGMASNLDPLDSAIILSRSSSDDDSFKLHAREIIEHPIRARLVTVSACYGSGTRSYAGEGLVGLAWAFLHAGAHNVIGALWEVSDESTTQLMGSLYRNIEAGMAPDPALRQAKLSLLRSGKEFRKPFYWAPFQLYTGR